MDAALKALCTQTVTIEPFTGVNANGEATYGAGVSYKAHIGGQNRMMRNALGQLVTDPLKVVLSTAPSVSTKDKITLPATYTPQTPPIVGVAQLFHETGQSHVAVYL